MNIKKVIKMIFGNAYDNKLFKIAYWFGVVFYIICVPLLLIISYLVESKEILIISLISLIIYPLMFRLSYNINAYLYKMTIGDLIKME